MMTLPVLDTRRSGSRQETALPLTDMIGAESRLTVPRFLDPKIDGRTVNADLDLLRLGRLLVSELPLMMMINLLVMLGGAVVAGLAVTVAPLAPLAAAALLGPVLLGAVAVSARLLTGEVAGVRDLGKEICARARTGIGVALLPAIVATLLVATVGLFSANEEQRWLLLPVGADVTALIVLALGSFYAFPLSVLANPHGRERWLTALALAGRELTATLGMAAIIVLLALSIPFLGPFLLLIAAAPLLLLSTAVTRSAIAKAAR